MAVIAAATATARRGEYVVFGRDSSLRWSNSFQNRSSQLELRNKQGGAGIVTESDASGRT